MIKTDGKDIYISCGESCYCIPIDGGAGAAYFGKRIEPEDNLSEILPTESSEFFVTDEEGNEISDFKFVSVTTEEKSDCLFPSLEGGKTVKLTLADSKLGLTAELFYTPYVRGAVARRCAVKYTGGDKIAIRVPSASVRLSGEYKAGSLNNGINYLSLDGDDSYGLLTLFGGKCDIKYSCAAGVTTASVFVDKSFTLNVGGSVETPETVLVRSEYGADGVMRALHDILREFAIPARFEGGRRRVVFYADKPSPDLVDHAAEFGADALVVPITPDCKKAGKVAEACKKRGVLFGARIDVSDRDLSQPACVSETFKDIHNIIESLGASYIALSVKPSRCYDAVLGLYALVKKIEKAHPEIIMEGVGDAALLRYTPIFGVADTDTAFVKRGALCRVVPPSSIACRVTGESSLKTEFDLCSLGALAYTPTVDRSQGSRLAVRAQVFSYQDDSPLVLNGDFYFADVFGGDFGLCAVSKDKSKAYAVYRREGGDRLKFRGLDDRNLYRVRELDTVLSGAALSGAGVAVPEELKPGDTMSFHLRQVADYEP